MQSTCARIGGAACLLAGVLFVPFVAASVIPKMTIEQVYAHAHHIVQGTVIHQKSEWKEYDGNRLIFTYSTIQITQSWKRATPESGQIVVRTVGGEVDGYHQTLLGEASLSVNEEVLLFLQDEQGWSRPSVVGFYQGKHRVERNRANKAVSLVRDKGQSPGAKPRFEQRVSMSVMLKKLADLEMAAASTAAPVAADDGPVAPAGKLHPLVPQKR